MWKRLPLSDLHAALRRLGSVITVGLVLSVCGSSATAAGGYRTGIRVAEPRVAHVLMTCLQKRTGRQTEKAAPGNCDLRGYKGEHGKELVRVPIEDIHWEDWGSWFAEGEPAINVRTHANVSVRAWRRIRCADGRVFYSRAQVLNRQAAVWYTIRLPICGDSLPN